MPPLFTFGFWVTSPLLFRAKLPATSELPSTVPADAVFFSETSPASKALVSSVRLPSITTGAPTTWDNSPPVVSATLEVPLPSVIPAMVIEPLLTDPMVRSSLSTKVNAALLDSLAANVFTSLLALVRLTSLDASMPSLSVTMEEPAVTVVAALTRIVPSGVVEPTAPVKATEPPPVPLTVRLLLSPLWLSRVEAKVTAPLPLVTVRSLLRVTGPFIRTIPLFVVVSMVRPSSTTALLVISTPAALLVVMLSASVVVPLPVLCTKLPAWMVDEAVTLRADVMVRSSSALLEPTAPVKATSPVPVTRVRSRGVPAASLSTVPPNVVPVLVRVVAAPSFTASL